MKRIGILTQYYNSCNYGGVLQAYALTKFLNDNSFSAEQICYDAEVSEKKQRKSFRAKASAFLQKMLFRFIKNKVKKRKNGFFEFRNAIPHSAEVYTSSNMADANSVYDLFVVGSDQVWNPKDYDPIFFLDFVKDDKKCVSYAASISQKELTEEQRDRFEYHLKRFSAVSLRENDIHLINDLIEKDVEWVLDPTMLLSSSQWDEVANNRKIEQKYVLCYYLGKDKRIRDVAKKFAKKKGLRLVTFAHITGMYRRCDFGFGDEQILDASPQDFISLIKNAEYILTDSFHASVFSIIYRKEFFVFGREHFSGMSTRIYSLLSLINAVEHFCDTCKKANETYLLESAPIKYSDLLQLEQMKQKSVEFLLNATNGI